VRHAVSLDHGLTHSETIMPAVDEALSGCGYQVKDMDCIACTAGPGSFTGVRIGVCAAKALAHAVGAKCARIDALEALAAAHYGFDGTVCTILDARRGQVYGAAFRFAEGERPVRVVEDCAAAIETYFDLLPDEGRLIFTGDGVAVNEKRICERFGERALIAPAHMRYLRADSAAQIAAVTQDVWMEAGELTPIYLRAPQAEREREAKLKEQANG
jgi:tRNA threonylcarbamoyladenosine biosynthesis protein TsaB